MPARPGQPLQIPAKTWNRVERLVGVPGIERQEADRLIGVPTWIPMRIKNGTGSDREQKEVLSWSGVELDDDDNPDEYRNRPVLTGKTPAEGDKGKIAVLLEPIPDGDLGWVAIGGVVPAFVNIVSTNHTHVALTDADATELTSVDSGTQGYAKIVDVTGTGTGTKTALIQLDSPSTVAFRIYLFSLTSGWTSNQATADITELDGTSLETGATINDEDGTFSSLGSGDSGKCFKQDGSYSTIQAPCPSA